MQQFTPVLYGALTAFLVALPIITLRRRWLIPRLLVILFGIFSAVFTWIVPPFMKLCLIVVAGAWLVWWLLWHHWDAHFGCAPGRVVGLLTPLRDRHDGSFESDNYFGSREEAAITGRFGWAAVILLPMTVLLLR